MIMKQGNRSKNLLWHGRIPSMPFGIPEKEGVVWQATVWKCQPAILMMEEVHGKQNRGREEGGLGDLM
ncbi:hypothetical protein [Selenomonas sputigena]|jgi:hypothetical protein|uniref:hypothetical protein n=1 Tax=Selenomonas sputigena TaxID=69823 RepID=UPI0012DCEF53|nr:hypothetical protein [Selenomonas sputigena]